MKYYVGIDLGGTNIAVGVVDENYHIVGRGRLKTGVPRPAAEIVKDMAKATEMAIRDAGITLEDVQWIGVGTPGSIEPNDGIIVYANNLYFKDVPVGKMLFDLLNKKVYVENDANAAAYGEMLAGAAKDKNTALMITLGTGVGCGIIIDEKIYAGYNHQGGELGHMGMIYEGELCTCGNKGCIEAYCSATALIRMTKESMNQDKLSKMWDIVNGDIDTVDGKTAFDAMRAGDENGKNVVSQYIAYLSYAVNSFINAFQPEIFVVGGGVSKEGDTLLEPIRRYLSDHSYGYNPNNHTQLVPAILGNDAGIIGAAFLGNLYN